MIRVALAGPMGSGKSTVGARLAERLGVDFVDLDREIGDVAALFAAQGEAGFRAREREVLRSCVSGWGVLALGGGTVVDPGNRAALAAWRVFVLRAPAATLRARVGAGDGRPLADRLEELLVARAAAYDAAGEGIETGDRAVDDVVEAIATRLAR